MKHALHAGLAVALVTVLLLGACPGNVTIELPDNTDVTIPLPGLSNTVTVEIFNDTDYEVDPRIRFDNDTSWLAGLFPSEDLATGILDPGDLSSYNMDCDEVGLIFSDTAGQFLHEDTIGQADTTRTLKREEDFECGDIIQFHFIGDGDGFGVVVSVNDIVVD